MQAIRDILQFGSHHPRQVLWLRVAIGAWLLYLIVNGLGSSAGHGWIALLLAAEALNIALGSRLFLLARDRHARR